METLRRIAVCITCIATTWYVNDYVFHRNLMAEIYSPDIDRISAPIISNQILLLTLGLLILPTTLLASARVVEKLSSLREIFQIVILIPFAGIYGISIRICLGLTLSSLDRHHIEMGLSYAAMLALIITALSVDVIRIYRRVYKKQFPQ